MHHAMLGLFMSLGFTNSLTTFIKLMIGRPRPDFLARCFDNDVPDPIPWASPGYPACTGNPGVIAEGRRSFPSGHSSMSFSSMFYLTLFLINFLETFDEEVSPHPSIPKARSSIESRPRPSQPFNDADSSAPRNERTILDSFLLL